MDLKQLFDALPPEQRAKFGAVKDEAGLNAFLEGNGITLTGEQRAGILGYIAKGVAPVQDDELENAGGGCGGGSGGGSGGGGSGGAAAPPQDLDPLAFCKYNFPNDGGGKCTCLDMRGAYRGATGACMYLWSSARWIVPDGEINYVCKYIL